VITPTYTYTPRYSHRNDTWGIFLLTKLYPRVYITLSFNEDFSNAEAPMRQTSTIKRATVTSPVLKNRFGTPLDQLTKSNGDFNQKVAEKAYELYLARGCENGHDVEDWIQAEKIVKGM
jgi:hypothetical protein